MRPLPGRSLHLVPTVLLLLSLPLVAGTKTVRPQDRILEAIDGHRTVTLAGGIHPALRGAPDAGRVPADVRMERMMLLLEPTAEQREALAAFVEEQHDPASVNFHRWLTPEQFGARFGVSQDDLRRIMDWLSGQGFEVEAIPASGLLVIFSGTAGQVESAFHTEMHRYTVHGRQHIANATDPQIPEALAGVVNGFVSLNDFETSPQHSVRMLDSAPEYTSGSAHYLAPADFATIYDAAALYAASVDGAGQAIAVVGRTNLKLGDVQSFRAKFGLPANDPAVLLNGPDPGIVSSSEQLEASLDVEWAGAVAPKAAITLVVSGSTNTSDGVTLSAQYIVNRNLAPVMTLSFGACEAAMGRSGNAFWNSLWQQAAAQGITVLVSSGDSGAAGCDSASATTAKNGGGVNALCSSPYSTCVGGTQFTDSSNPSLYWGKANGAGYGSALGYIPEAVWNESGSSGLWASGGGASRIYRKPSWQAGPGVPADDVRYVPDVSLTSAGHDGYLVVVNGSTAVVAGTSAAAPAMAGLMALTVQKNARVGNANPSLYNLAVKQAAGGAAVFHDVTSGDNSVPGVTGFNAGTGYDPATGLGSVDAFVMANQWVDGSTQMPGFSVGATPASVQIGPGGTAAITVAVSSTSGFNSAVALTISGLPAGVTGGFSSTTVASASGTSTLTLSATGKPTAGTYRLTITGTSGSLARSAAVTLVVPAACSYVLDPASASLPFTAGSYTVKVTAGAGCVWTASTQTSWITMRAGTSVSGTGALSYSVTANSGTTVRTGSMTVAGKTVTVVQAGAVVFTVTPLSVSVGAAASTGTLSIASSSSTASWTAVSSAGWISITHATTGTGSGTVTYSVAANSGSGARTGTLTVAGKTVTVAQAGGACTYSLGAVNARVGAVAGSYSVPVTAPAGCSWTAASGAAWITIAAGGAGNGNGVVTFAVAANTASSTRVGSLTAGGKTVSVTQDALAPFSMSPSSASYTAAAATGTINVAAPSSAAMWAAASNAPWISVIGGASGAGSRAVRYSVAANPSTAARTGSITVAKLVFSISQAGLQCSYSVSPLALSAAAGGGSYTVQVTAPAGCAWPAATSSTFLSLASGASGNGSGGVRFAVAANSGGPRTGSLMVAGKAVTVTQDGVPGAVGLSATAANYPAAGAAGWVTVMPSSSTAAWRAVSNADWIRITYGASGSGRGMVGFAVSANTAAASRTGTMTIAGQTFTVVQSGLSCTYTAGAATVSPRPTGVLVSIPVITPAGCGWTSSSNAPWLTVVSGASGTGSGTTTLLAALNTTNASRSATVTIGSLSLTVVQGR